MNGLRTHGHGAGAVLASGGSYPGLMGRFIYGRTEQHVEIEDRTLAHLRIVFMNKLRRSESFSFEVPTRHGTGHQALWIHPTLPFQLVFTGSRTHAISMPWVNALMESANSPEGLRLVPEPNA